MSKKIYFPNLNGLRFIAASMVFFPHTEQIKSFMGLPSNLERYAHPDFAGLGVILFFVLSGFLITFLLIQEKKDTGNIDIRMFYMRRVLRIWPVYYLVVAAGFFLLPHIPALHVPGLSDLLHHNFWLKAALFIFFLPNVVMVAFPAVPFASPAWSVGVEEQFYFVWPWLVNRSKAVIRMLLGVLVFYLLVRIALLWLMNQNPGNTLFAIASTLWKYFSIDCMAIGGMAAYLLFGKRTALVRFIMHPISQACWYGLVIMMIAGGFTCGLFTYPVYSLFFAAIILNLAGNKRSILSLEGRGFNYLGKISYGLYMYHFFAIVAAIRIAQSTGMVTDTFIYVTAGGITLGLATLSYEWFEHRFIQAKVRYSRVITGDNVKEIS